MGDIYESKSDVKKCLGGKRIKISLLVYYLLFIGLFFIVFRDFWKIGKVFIWVQDGFSEHVPKVWYMTEYLRAIGKALISGMELPSIYVFSLGLGANTLSYTGVWFLEPFDLLMSFVPRRHFEQYYCFFVVLRYYFSGISFYIFCKYKRRTAYASVLGGLIYSFSGFALEAGIKHPTFLMPMILLPLLLLSLEILLEKNKGTLFSILIGISAISSVYFLYMNTIIGTIYFVFILVEKKILNCKKIISVIVFYVLGIMFAAVTVLPIAIAIVSSSRGETITISTPSLWSYGENRIKELFIYFAAPNKGNCFWMIQNY